MTTLYEHRERQAAGRDACAWELVECEGLTVSEERIEPDEFERLVADWLGRLHGRNDRLD